jgi:hypothetical protein
LQEQLNIAVDRSDNHVTVARLVIDTLQGHSGAGRLGHDRPTSVTILEMDGPRIVKLKVEVAGE